MKTLPSILPAVCVLLVSAPPHAAAAASAQTSEASAALAGLTEPGRVPRPHLFVDPWKKWAKDPVNIPLSLEVQNLLAQSNSIVEVKLGTDTYRFDGLDCNTATNCPGVVGGLRMHRDYKLTFIATNLTCAQLFLKVNPAWEPLSTSGKNEVPNQYVLLVDNTAGFPLTEWTSSAFGNWDCGYYSNSWTIQITDQRPYHWYADDSSDDPGPAPGDGSFLSMGGAKDLHTNQVSLDWSVSLGRLFDGTAAGRLRIRESGLSREIYTPTNIYYVAGSEVERSQVDLVASSGDGVLRQVRAYQAFVDLVAQANQTTLNFYHASQVATNKDANGIYNSITGFPFVVWTVQNPEPSTTNKLYIIESRNGAARTNSLVFNPASTTETWTLRYGTNSEERVETRGVTFSFSPVTNRLETVAIRYASSNSPAYKCRETYTLFGWGWELTQTCLDPDNNNLITTYEYNTNTDDLLTYGKPDVFRYPDGFWEKRLYDHDSFLGALQYVLRPNKSEPADPTNATPDNCYLVEYLYNDDYGNVDYIRHYYNGHDFGYNTHTNGQAFRQDVVGAYSSLPFVESSDSRYCMEGADYALGTYALLADGSYPMGTADHPLYFFDCRNADMVMYYHGGAYNPSTRTFTPNGTDTSDGPDWRQSVIHFGYPEHYEPSEDDSVQVDSAEGQTLYGMSGVTGSTWLQPNCSYRVARIFQGGSLVQQECSVFTGVTGVGEPVFDLYQRYVYQNDTLGHPTNILVYNSSSSSAARTIYQADYRGGATHDGQLPFWTMDESGLRTEYQYDSLQRVTSATKKGVSAGGGFAAQPDIVTAMRYDPTGKQLEQTVSSSGLGLTNRWLYDVAGRQISATDQQGLTTTTAYDLANHRITTTLPSGATDIQENYLDRRLATRTGTGVVQETHDYWLTNSQPDPRVRLMEKVTYGSTNARWKTIGTDWFGLPVRTETPGYGGNGSLVEYCLYLLNLNTPHWVRKTGQSLRYNYLDFDGVVGKTTILDGEDNFGLDSCSRITRTLKQFVKEGSDWFHTRTNLTYLVDDDATPTVTSVTKQRLSGFGSTNIQSEITTWDADSNATVVTTYIDRSGKKVTQVAATAQSALNATNITINGLAQWESTATVAAPTRHYYDALGRETSVTSPLGFSSWQSYNQSGQVAGKSDFTGAWVAYEYYANGVTGAGQLKTETRSNGKKTFHSYTIRGEPYRTWGDVPYPEERVYSDYGELVELHTFRGGSDWNLSSWSPSPGTPDTTTWTYDGPSGLLTSKTDAASHAVSYTYTNSMLFTRTWARGVMVTNYYDSFADLVRQDYNDGTPSVQFNNYSRAGLPRGIVGASGTSELAYDYANRLTLATNVDGLLAGVAVTNHFQAPNGRDWLAVLGLGTTLQHNYTYDAYGRMDTVSAGVYSATYGYLPNSDLLRSTTCRNNGTTNLVTTRSWEYGMRLGVILNQVNGVNVSSHAYVYDALNRRTQASLEDGSIWKYDYNDRDELTGARRYWPDWSPVSGQRFGYDYDNIGNRKTASAGGDTNGANWRTTSYTANALNEYTSITTPGYKDICGAAIATNSVAVNANTADRKVEYFHREISIGNTNAPLWQDVSVTSAGTTNTGGFVFPANSQALTYDLDGNLAFDGIWTYEWDGENRLIAMTMTNVASIAATNRLRLEFAYDFQGRRVQKKVSHWNGGPWTLDSDSRFVYDGWNLLAILNSDLSLQTSFMWGQDLSGTMDQAGGIGGLLMLTTHSIPNTNCFVSYDGNANVMALLDAGGEAVAGRYEYSPFGELLRATGPLANANPFRFSTKSADDETGLVYYGYRYYSPGLGRWLSRDPIDEADLINLYNALRNCPVGVTDTDGRMLIQLSVTSLLQASLRGALLTGVINAGVTTLLNKGPIDWSKVGNAFKKGAITGAITGGFGYLAKSFAPALSKIGAKGEPTKVYGFFTGGLTAGLGFATGQVVDGRNLKDSLSSPAGKFGFAVAVGLGATMGVTGVSAQENDWGFGLTLDAALKVAGTVGGALGLEVYDAAENVRELFSGYKDRLDGVGN
jgi:RHS repeat-associated protein